MDAKNQEKQAKPDKPQSQPMCGCDEHCECSPKCDCEKEIAGYVDSLKRLQAEFENYVKRVEKERGEVVKHAKCVMILKFLNIIEDIDRIVESAKNSGKEDMEKALQMVCRECHKVLEGEHVHEIECRGEPDVYRHEVIMHVDGNVPDNHIAQVIQKGYVMGDKVIRYAKVAIKGKKENTGGK